MLWRAQVSKKPDARAKSAGPLRGPQALRARGGRTRSALGGQPVAERASGRLRPRRAACSAGRQPAPRASFQPCVYNQKRRSRGSAGSWFWPALRAKAVPGHPRSAVGFNRWRTQLALRAVYFGPSLKGEGPAPAGRPQRSPMPALRPALHCQSNLRAGRCGVRVADPHALRSAKAVGRVNLPRLFGCAQGGQGRSPTGSPGSGRYRHGPRFPKGTFGDLRRAGHPRREHSNPLRRIAFSVRRYAGRSRKLPRAGQSPRACPCRAIGIAMRSAQSMP